MNCIEAIQIIMSECGNTILTDNKRFESMFRKLYTDRDSRLVIRALIENVPQELIAMDSSHGAVFWRLVVRLQNHHWFTEESAILAIQTWANALFIELSDSDVLLSQALDDFRQDAEFGNAESQYLLGSMYAREHDYEAASKWYRKSADLGFAEAEYRVGQECEKGDSVQDYHESKKWYQKALDQGNQNAKDKLYPPMIYDSMDNLTRAIGEAIEWHRNAVDQGLVEALNNLAQSSELSPKQQFILGYAYHEAQLPSKATEWYLKAAEQGHIGAQYELSGMYSNGGGVTLNKVEAAKWMLKVANQGNAQGQYLVGILYFDGGGVPQDKVEAEKWMLKAAKQGYIPADIYLIRFS